MAEKKPVQKQEPFILGTALPYGGAPVANWVNTKTKKKFESVKKQPAKGE